MRTERLLNREWKFAYGEYRPETQFDDRSWADVGIPHSFGIPYFMENDFYTGYGTYTKKLCFSQEEQKQRILLEFSGVFQVAEIYLNGELLKVHKGGYTPFVVDLSGKVSESNELLVCVNNLWDPCIAPRAGEHQFNGGIYRDVKLIFTEENHVDWHGTFVYTKELLEGEGTGPDGAVLGVETTVILNDFSEQAVLVTTLWDGERAMQSREKRLEMVQSQTVYQRFEVDGILPWSPEHPKLYQMTSEIRCGETCTDCYSTEFGIRTTRFDPDQGFFLNGRHYDILGANVHQDHAGWADAVTHTGIERDIKLIKGCGMNFIRGSHYPHHTYFAGVCDREGILFWSELCYWGTGGPNRDGYWTASAYPVRQEDEEAFEQNCLDTLEEMILANRNHPSIIVWSMSNEPFFSEKSVYDKAKRLLRRLVARSHQLDPTRAAAAGGAQRGDFDILGDLAGYNGDGASLYRDPGFPNFVSEYGSVVSDRPGKAEPRYRDGVETDYLWRSGKSLWCGFHHGSIFGQMGHMGMIDYHRLPLNTWYWYREQLLGIPAPDPRRKGTPAKLKISADRTRFQANGQEDVWIHVELLDQNDVPLSNTADVLLEVIEGDGIFPTGKRILLTEKQGSMLDGQGAIELMSWYGGKNVIRAVTKGLPPVFLEVFAEGEPRSKELVPMTPPPYRTPMPKAGYVYDTAACRPVFASSSGRGCEPAYVTVDASQSWYPACDEDEWVMVDLEGSRRLHRIEVITEHFAGDRLELLLSVDAETFDPVEFAWNRDRYEWEKDCEYRYIRVPWRKEMKGVVEVCALVKEE